MQYAQYARVKVLQPTNVNGTRVRVSLYTTEGSRAARVVRGFDFAKSFREQTADILADLGATVNGNTRILAISDDEEVWVL